MAFNPQFKINQMAKDMGLKSKELTDLLADKGIGDVKSQKALTEQEFNVLFQSLTEANQVDNIYDYMDGKTCIPSKIAAAKAAEKAAKAAEKKKKKKAEKEAKKAEKAAEEAKLTKEEKQAIKDKKKASRPPITELIPLALDVNWRGEGGYMLQIYLMQLPIHLLACWSYHKADTIWAPIATHAIVNLLTCGLILVRYFL